MSIEDLLNYFRRKRDDDSDPDEIDIFGRNERGTVKEENNVKIIAKRTSYNTLSRGQAVNWAVFGLENGSIVQLAIKDWRKYSVMFEGDVGTLRYVGKRFVGFVRNKDDD